MGLLGRLRGLFGGRDGDAHDPDPEDLLALPGLAMAAEDRAGYALAGEAALCFAAANADGFEQTLADLQDVLEATEAEAGTSASWHDDAHGYRWLVLADDEPEDLATGLQFAAETFRDRDYGDQLLAALVAFEPATARRSDDPTAYFVYSFERGRYYPFVPEGTDDRDTATEFRLQSVLSEEAPFEDDRSQWYPLWPDEPGAHPWA